jgi:hypothetical protein
MALLQKWLCAPCSGFERDKVVDSDAYFSDDQRNA